MTPIDLKHLRELLANAPRYPEAELEGDGLYVCPMCAGAGLVNSVFITGDHMAGGIQCYGVGPDHINLEALARAAVKALPALLDRLERAERNLGAEKVHSAALSTMPPLTAKPAPKPKRRKGGGK